MSVRLALIVARDRNGIIGRDGDLPWRLKSDMAHFKAVTAGKPCVMGRKTWESLHVQPLPGRPCLILTRNADYRADGAEVFTDFSDLLDRARIIAVEMNSHEVMIIGGAEIYALALPFADRLYLTDVDTSAEGDARFPLLNDDDWNEVSQEDFQAGPKDDFAFSLRTLERRA